MLCLQKDAQDLAEVCCVYRSVHKKTVNFLQKSFTRCHLQYLSKTRNTVKCKMPQRQHDSNDSLTKVCSATCVFLSSQFVFNFSVWCLWMYLHFKERLQWILFNYLFIYLFVRAGFSTSSWFCCTCLVWLGMQFVIGGVRWHGDKNSCLRMPNSTYAITVWLYIIVKKVNHIIFFISPDI